MKKLAKILCLVMALCLVFALAACGAPAAPADTAEPSAPADTNTPADTGDAATPDTTEIKTIVFGTSADYSPFEFHILKDGVDTIVGIDVWLAEKIAADMGVELVVKDISFDYLIQELGQGNVDFVIAAMELNEERDAAVDFSEPYYTDVPAMVLVKADRAAEFTGWDSFDGLTVGAQNATTKAARVGTDMPGANLLALASVNDLVNNLVNDKCDAIFLDGAVAQQFADAMDELVVADLDYGSNPEPFRVAVQEGDPDGLLESINATIAAAIADGSITQWAADADDLSDEAIGLE